MPPRSLSLVALLSLVMASTAPAAVVLQYHHVSEETPASTSTSPARFAMHLGALAEHGFRVVPLQDLVKAIETGQPLPDRTAAITFDDGYRSIYQHAWPALQQRGWPFTVFVNPEPHDRRSTLYMSWDQLREIRAGGATIANHSFSHAHLIDREDQPDDASWRAWVIGEIRQASERIRQEIGDAPALFAWPFGEFDADLLEILGSLDYAGFGQQSGPLATYSDRRALPRFPFGGPYGERGDFVTKINSLPMPLAGAESQRLQTAEGRELHDIALKAPARPVLWLEFAPGFDPSRIACFVSGQGDALLQVDENRVRVQAGQPLGPGPSRYNCTAPSDQAGRFHWYSQPWFVQ